MKLCGVRLVIALDVGVRDGRCLERLLAEELVHQLLDQELIHPALHLRLAIEPATPGFVGEQLEPYHPF